MLKKRLIVGLSGCVLVTAIVWFGQPFFTILLTIWGLVAAYEFFHLVKKENIPVLTIFGLIWTLLFILIPYYKYEFTVPSLLTSAIVIPLILLLFRRNKEQAFTGWVWTMGGILYIGWLLSYWIVNSAPGGNPTLTGTLPGRDWIYLGLFVTFASDTAAYFAGRKWGRHHLAPVVSPKKTWEGSIAGIIAAIVVSLIFTLPTPVKLPPEYFSWWQAIILGAVISVAGQTGDLAKSLFKRNMHVKDSSNYLPGHGGFLDRMDSVAFAGVVVYYYLVWVNIIPLR